MSKRFCLFVAGALVVGTLCLWLVSVFYHDPPGVEEPADERLDNNQTHEA